MMTGLRNNYFLVVNRSLASFLLVQDGAGVEGVERESRDATLWDEAPLGEAAYPVRSHRCLCRSMALEGFR